MPGSVGPGFYPGVVIVGMCPTRGVHLARRNAHGAEGGNGEGAFLAATPRGGLEGGHGRGGAGIGGLVGDVFVAPMVDFQHGIAHAQPFDALLELVVVGGAEFVETLVVDPDG